MLKLKNKVKQVLRENYLNLKQAFVQNLLQV